LASIKRTRSSSGVGRTRPAPKAPKGGAPRIRSSHEPAPHLAPRRALGAATADSARPSSPKAESKRAGGPKTRKAVRTESPSVATDEARETAIAVAVAALEKKAVGLEILDVAGKVDYADFLVLMTGRSDRQVVALSQGIEEALRKKNRRPLSVEGLPHANWVLMDYGDVVVHVFQDETRGLYDLEGLWLDARRLSVPIPDELR